MKLVSLVSFVIAALVDWTCEHVRSPHCSRIYVMTGSLLLSHTVSGIVPSAAGGLTIVFGMGTGVSHRRITTSQMIFS